MGATSLGFRDVGTSGLPYFPKFRRLRAVGVDLMQLHGCLQFAVSVAQRELFHCLIPCLVYFWLSLHKLFLFTPRSLVQSRFRRRSHRLHEAVAVPGSFD